MALRILNQDFTNKNKKKEKPSTYAQYITYELQSMRVNAIYMLNTNPRTTKTPHFLHELWQQGWLESPLVHKAEIKNFTEKVQLGNLDILILSRK